MIQVHTYVNPHKKKKTARSTVVPTSCFSKTTHTFGLDVDTLLATKATYTYANVPSPAQATSKGLEHGGVLSHNIEMNGLVAYRYM